MARLLDSGPVTALALLLLSAAPALTLDAAPLRDPQTHATIGAARTLTPLTLTPGRTPTRPQLHFTARSFDLTSALDTTDPQTRLDVTLAQPRFLEHTGPWRVAARPETHPVLGATATHLTLGFARHLGAPVAQGDLPLTGAPTPLPPQGPPSKIYCRVLRMHPTPSLESPTWEPASYAWDFLVLDARPAHGWRTWLARSDALFVWGSVRDEDVSCTTGAGGGFGLDGTSGASDGFVVAREVRLPAGTTLAVDGGAPLMTLRFSQQALLLDDGSVRLEVRSGNSVVSLHDVFATPAPRANPDAGATLHGVGSASDSSSDRPFACPDAGTVAACFTP